MELTYLHTFRAVAYHLSFTKAAQELGYAQSSVTMQMQKLELSYGVKLFERYGKGLRVTSAGEELISYAIRILDLTQESKEVVSKQGGGTLSIGTIDSLASYYLPAYLQQLRKAHPALVIRLQTGSEADLVEQVKEGTLDMALMLENGPTDPLLQWIRIREEPLVLVANPQHAWIDRQDLTMDQLGEAEWIMTEDSCKYRSLLERFLRSHGVPYQISLELGNPESIKRSIREGNEIALLPRMAVEEELRRGELRALPFTHEDLRLDLYLLHHPKKWMSNAMKDLKNWFQ